MNKKQIFAVVALIVFAALTRLIPHPLNFTPVIAMGLFAGRIFKSPMGYLAPVGAMLLSDAFIGFSSISVMVYGTLALIFLLGWANSKNTWANLGVNSLVASVLFFVTTNLAVWAMAGMYPMTFEGLVACYVAGVPFFHNTLLSTVLYAAAFKWVADRQWSALPAMDSKA